MKTVGSAIEWIDKNHEKAAPYTIAVILVLTVSAITTLPSYEDYCKEPNITCKQEK